MVVMVGAATPAATAATESATEAARIVGNCNTEHHQQNQQQLSFHHPLLPSLQYEAMASSSAAVVGSATAATFAANNATTTITFVDDRNKDHHCQNNHRDSNNANTTYFRSLSQPLPSLQNHPNQYRPRRPQQRRQRHSSLQDIQTKNQQLKLEMNRLRAGRPQARLADHYRDFLESIRSGGYDTYMRRRIQETEEDEDVSLSTSEAIGASNATKTKTPAGTASSAMPTTVAAVSISTLQNEITPPEEGNMQRSKYRSLDLSSRGRDCIHHEPLLPLKQELTSLPPPLPLWIPPYSSLTGECQAKNILNNETASALTSGALESQKIRNNVSSSNSNIDSNFRESMTIPFEGNANSHLDGTMSMPHLGDIKMLDTPLDATTWKCSPSKLVTRASSVNAVEPNAGKENITMMDDVISSQDYAVSMPCIRDAECPSSSLSPYNCSPSTQEIESRETIGMDRMGSGDGDKQKQQQQQRQQQRPMLPALLDVEKVRDLEGKITQSTMVVVSPPVAKSPAELAPPVAPAPIGPAPVAKVSAIKFHHPSARFVNSGLYSGLRKQTNTHASESEIHPTSHYSFGNAMLPHSLMDMSVSTPVSTHVSTPTLIVSPKLPAEIGINSQAMTRESITEASISSLDDRSNAIKTFPHLTLNDNDPLLVFLRLHQQCIKGSVDEFYTWLVKSEDIDSIGALKEAVSDEDYLNHTMKDGNGSSGLKGFKRKAFLRVVMEHEEEAKLAETVSPQTRKPSSDSASVNRMNDNASLLSNLFNDDDLINPLEELVCPIGRTLMTVDPVLASDGVTYERACIENWFHTNMANIRTAKENLKRNPCSERDQRVVENGTRSPAYGTAMKNLSLMPNTSIRNMARAYQERKNDARY